MKYIGKFDRYITIIFFVTIITVVATSYIVLREVINLQNKHQKAAIIPLFSLIHSEIIRPLSIANFMANDQFLIEYANEEQVEKEKMLRYLTQISSSYKMTSFIAIEKHNLMIDSNNKQTRLNSKEAEWFYRLKASNKTYTADIGNRDDPHLYFDNKIFDKAGNFVGFTGVAIDLNYFASKFALYRNQFGIELFFVDENNILMMSSNHLMKTEAHPDWGDKINVTEFDWYQLFNTSQKEITENTLSVENDDYQVSRMKIQALDWQMYIVSPSIENQGYLRLFLSRFAIFIVMAFVLYFLFIHIINYFKYNLLKSSETDFLTKLPNRSFINWKFKELTQQHDTVCVVIADIDNFKEINDTHGHLMGDDALKVIANMLNENLRQIDFTGRWGGEEFIMIFPDTSIEHAKEITDRIRQNIEQYWFGETQSAGFSITVSFGLRFSKLDGTKLEDIIADADKALYQAKENGKNQIVAFDPSSS